MTASVNHWQDDDHVAWYRTRADTIPHRADGEAVVLELIGERAGRVLDLGTGDGRLMDLVRQVDPSSTGLAVDFSPAMLAAAQDRFAGEPDVQVAEHNLDEPLRRDWGEFTTVVSSFAIHHVVDDRKQALFGEVFDLLEPGGRFVNLEHVASPTGQLHLDFLAQVGVDPAEDDPSNKLAPVEDQLGWLRSCGFVDVDCFWKWRELALLAGRRPTLL